ncbi:MAG: acetoacetate--CoA ligase [Granulosicoccus sp.]
MTETNKILWQPTAEQIANTRLTAFMQTLSNTDVDASRYADLYNWSISNSQEFWSRFWDFTGIVGIKGDVILDNGDDIERAVWFPDARLNYAENLLQPFLDCTETSESGEATAIYFRAEDKVSRSLSYHELLNQVTAVTAWLRAQGVVKGDRVAAYMGNIPETVVAMLATTSLGAIWTSTSPDFGAQSVIERFGQTKPKILFTQDGYIYNGKEIDIREKVAEINKAVNSIQTVVSIPFLGLHHSHSDWNSLIDNQTDESLSFTPCGFNDPLFILYSSGTTGQPKCITHKVGGTLLQHKKEHQLHTDIRSGDNVFFFTTCGWMMWNWLVSALASGASLSLYDGSPFKPTGNVLWDFADDTGMSVFGTSAKYIDALKKYEFTPKKTHKLSHLRTLCSTGSVLAPESFDYVYESIKTDICLSSISGGTDILSCFVLGNANLPVRRGESQCRGLGMAVEVFNGDGVPVENEKGELVCTQTFPSQPAFFWDDDNGQKYHTAYFSTYKNIWHHGDYVVLKPEGGVVIYGRSDATLNPGGVRIGTAEIYRHVEQLEEVMESIVIGQEWHDDTRVVLFVVLKDDYALDEALTTRICQSVRKGCTPRHVPSKIIQVSDIPRTKSGKIVELAVREVVHGRAVKNIHALANPEALDLYRNITELARN